MVDRLGRFACASFRTLAPKEKGNLAPAEGRTRLRQQTGGVSRSLWCSDRLSGTLQRPTRWQNTATDSVAFRGFSQHREHIILFLFTDRQFSVFREHTGPFLFTARWFYVTRKRTRPFLCTDGLYPHRFQAIDFTEGMSCGKPPGSFRLRLFQDADTKRKGKPRASVKNTCRGGSKYQKKFICP